MVTASTRHTLGVAEAAVAGVAAAKRRDILDQEVTVGVVVVPMEAAAEALVEEEAAAVPVEAEAVHVEAAALSVEAGV